MAYQLYLKIVLAISVFSPGLCKSCESIRTLICETELSYNRTVFPNLAGHISQRDASVAVDQFYPIVKLNCSTYTREFLCRVFIPECGANGEINPPSWEICQDVYNGCGTLISKFGFNWPEALNCSKFERSTLESLKTLATDDSIFWFGSGHVSACSTSRPSLACLWNTRPDRNDSIVSRLYNRVDVSTIDRLFDINYNYSAWDGASCNNMYSFPSGHFEVDPMSMDKHYAYQVRDMPTIRWTHEPSDLFALVVYDIGLYFLHALYVNVKGNDVNGATILKPYNGPLNPNHIDNPYVFLLYKQKHMITLTEDTRQGLINDTFRAIQNNSDIEYLASISWMGIQGDPYSIQRMKDLHIVDNCPLLISQALPYQSRPFLPRGQNLTISLDITYSPTAITFTSCCKSYKYGKKTFQLNPLGNMTVKTADVRSSAIPTVKLSKNFPYGSSLSDELYSLIMVDPDAASSGNNTHPHIHWMVLNIANGSIADGVTVLGYRGPQPPSGNHTYYFLLYSQTSMIEPKDFRHYTGSCSRCHFDIGAFTAKENLTLSSASWFIAGFDEYIRHLKVDENAIAEDVVCRGQPGFSPSCATEIFG